MAVQRRDVQLDRRWLPHAARFQRVVGALGLGGLTATTSPETAGYLHTLVKNSQFTWSSPVTNRLLLEAGLGTYRAAGGRSNSRATTRAALRASQELAALNGASAGLTYRSANWAQDWDNPNTWRAAASYIVGGHYLQGRLHRRLPRGGHREPRQRSQPAVHVQRRQAIQLTESLRVFVQKDRVRYDALYGQDQWTMGKMTLQGAIRYDHAWSYSPDQTIGPALIGGQTFLPTPLTFGRTDGVNYKDISLRGGVGLRRLRQRQDGDEDQRRPVRRSGEQPQQQLLDLQPDRAHRDDGGTDLDSTAAFRRSRNRRRQRSAVRLHQQRRQRRVPGFGQRRRSARQRRTTAAIDPALLNGWGIRPNDWQFGASVQQQIMPRVSIEVGYFRRWLQNFTATDNTLVTPADFTTFSHHRAVRSAAAGRRRLRGVGSLQRRRRRSSALDQQQHHGRLELRRSVPEVQRHADQHQRAAAQRPDVPGRYQHRQDRE